MTKNPTLPPQPVTYSQEEYDEAYEIGEALHILREGVEGAEADMAADGDAGERVDLFEYEVSLPYEAAKAILAALTAPQPAVEQMYCQSCGSHIFAGGCDCTRMQMPAPVSDLVAPEDAVERGAQMLAEWIGYAWDGLHERDLSEKYWDFTAPVEFQGGKPALRKIAAAMLAGAPGYPIFKVGTSPERTRSQIVLKG